MNKKAETNQITEQQNYGLIVATFFVRIEQTFLNAGLKYNEISITVIITTITKHFRNAPNSNFMHGGIQVT